MGGTTVRGFTNRQIYNSWAQHQVPQFFVQEHIDLFTENGTKEFPMLHWFQVTIWPGETSRWVRAVNCKDPSKTMKVHAFEPGPRIRLEENVHLASGTTYCEFSKVEGTYNYFIAIEVEDEPYVFDDGAGSYSAASTVAAPVFTPRTDGKIEISCATPEAEILFRESADEKWMSYDPSYPMFNTVPGKVIKAVAGKEGMKCSAQASYVIGYKLAKPTITVNEYPGAKVLVLESPEQSIVHGLALKHTINGVETTSTLVETGDVVVAWATKAGGSYTDSDTATLTLS